VTFREPNPQEGLLVMDEHRSVGERIAYWRRRRGLTQEVLAGLVGRSVPWLSRIERGERTMEKIQDLLALARVLKIPPGDLIGGIELPPNGGDPLEPPRGIHAIRRVLLVPADREPPARPTLRANVQETARLRQAAEYETLGVVLPDVLSSARAAAAAGVPEGSWWLSVACQMASSLAIITGQFDLAWIAADAGVTAARESEDELLIAVAMRSVAHALHWAGEPDHAAATCSNAADMVAPTDKTPSKGWSVWGALQLAEAINSVRVQNAAHAYRLVRNAHTAARHVGPGRNDYWTEFGPANTAVYETAVALEASDLTEARRIADTVDVDELLTAERRARFLIEVARIYVILRDDGAAVAALLEAERYSTEELRYQVVAHELVRVCLKRERRSRTPGLRGLAQRLGVAD
jgi:transcriptional regulator with XRE-family HTH domain